MSTPPGMRCIPRTLPNGDRVHVYSNAKHIILQLRHQVPSEDDILEPAFKSAVSLAPLDAIVIARELFAVAIAHLSQPPQVQKAPKPLHPQAAPSQKKKRTRSRRGKDA